MIIGIISDTHNRVQRTTDAVNILKSLEVTAILHCGDLTGTNIVKSILDSAIQSYFVYGNNDDPSELKLSIKALGGIDLGYSGILNLGDRKIGMTHGDRPGLMQKLAAEEPDYLFFGHSHLATDFYQGTIRFINPGALHRAPKWTFATLDLATDQLTWHEVND